MMDKPSKPGDFDSYEIEEPSDEERAISSSEDELDILLNGTPHQKKKLIREYLTGESQSSSGDEFEKEMEAELSSTMKTMEGTWAPAAAPSDGGAAPTNPQMYDKVYFDSDSDDEDSPGSSVGRRQKQQTVLTNDELLYDPDEDDRDQAWVDARRRAYRVRMRPNNPNPTTAQTSQQQKQRAGLASSDAVLNCPACMSTLCLDCQRHEKYRTQYRAMFVMNCTVQSGEVLRYRHTLDGKKRGKKGKKKRRRGGAPPPPSPPPPPGSDLEELYHPVHCSECSTEVGVLDKDEVYHFFNILASHC
ncbi:E2F-associated phosphoprotein [Gouania willdenowi]|uniref:E2F-associated phosphoprotein n=1 Tax=Gouania willdenowi TaxID=441366 RepID=A0A8C5NG49_GOUWI|nr:E2F-associated phosphoprotein [Gouania willdenowi]